MDYTYFMASKTYIQSTITGDIEMKRSVPQGRIPNPPELVKVPLTIFVYPVTKQKLLDGASQVGMSLSSYGEFALVMFDYTILHSEELGNT